MSTTVTYPGAGVAADANIATAIATAMADDKHVIIPANANDWTTDGPAGDGQVVVNGTFTVGTDWNLGLGWTIAAGAAHGAVGTESDLAAAVAPLTSGKRYRVSFQILNYVAGSLTPLCGTALGTARSANGAFSELIIGNGTALALRKNATFVGDVDNFSVTEDSPRFAITMQAGLHIQIDGNVLGRAGNFLGFRDCVIGADKVDGWKLSGSGSVRMGGVTQFGTYAAPVAPYNAAVLGPSSPSEFRHVCSVRACDDWTIEGSLSFNGAGGDGLHVGASEPNQDSLHLQCTYYHVSGLTCNGNLRQGCSILTGIDASLSNCIFSNTLGVAPQSGLDIEPEYDNLNNIADVISNLTIYECQAFGNPSRDFFVNLSRMKLTSPPVILSYIRCRSRRSGSAQPWGWNLVNEPTAGAGPPSGTITLVDCIADGLDKQALVIGRSGNTWRLDQGAKIIVRNFWSRDCGRLLAEKPIQLALGATAGTGERILFDRVRVTDRYARAAIVKVSAPANCTEVRGLVLLDPDRNQAQTGTFPYLTYKNAAYVRQRKLAPLTYGG